MAPIKRSYVLVASSGGGKSPQKRVAASRAMARRRPRRCRRQKALRGAQPGGVGPAEVEMDVPALTGDGTEGAVAPVGGALLEGGKGPSCRRGSGKGKGGVGKVHDQISRVERISSKRRS